MAGVLDAAAAPSRAASGHARPHPLLRVTPPRLAWALGVPALALHGLVWGTAAPLGQAPWVGAALVVAGLGWMLWAWSRFVRVGNPIRPTDRPRVLVDDGPFAWGRHPMYLGMTTALLGAAVALGAPVLALAALGFWALVARVHVPHEEAQLRRAFGGWYSDYAADVPRWF